MRFPIPTAALAAALLAAGLVPLRAQTADQATPATPQPAAPAASPAPAQPAAPAPGQPATMADNLRPKFVAQGPEDVVASKLIGLSVTNAAGDTIGQIGDLVLDQRQTVKAWVIGVGGFLGIGSKYVAVDPSVLKLDRADGKTLKATIDTTKDQLAAAPEYVYLGKEKPRDAEPADTARKP